MSAINYCRAYQRPTANHGQRREAEGDAGLMNLTVNDHVLETLRPLFLAVEGTCEAWTDDEIVRRVLIRGAMEYAKSAGKSFDEVTTTAAQLRAALV